MSGPRLREQPRPAPESPGAATPGGLRTQAVVLERPRELALRSLDLVAPGDDDVVVDVRWTGVSTGTERLLWTGEMPPFPGMGYPLVPGYEAVGQVRWAGSRSGRSSGDWVFVPGSRGFQGAHGLFGAAASRLVCPGARAIPVGDSMGEKGTLLALAGTAQHAIAGSEAADSVLVVGHGGLGRLLARILMARPDREGKPPPTVWEVNPDRITDEAYPVRTPDRDEAQYGTIYDVSGADGILDTLVPRLAPGGEIVLAGFYHAPVSFAFPPAFMKEARIRVAAEWKPADLRNVLSLVGRRRMSLDGLITHRREASDAPEAYRTAFEDATCVKMILDWRNLA